MDILFLFPYLSAFLFPSIPFFVGLNRWKRIDHVYKPLILMMGVAFFNEVFRFIQVMNSIYKLELPIGLSYISYNLYIIFISILFLKLFKNFRVFDHFKGVYILLIVVFLVFWIIDHFFIPGNTIFNPTKYFRIFYSFILCLLAVQKLNMLLVTERKSLIKNSAFWVCIAVLFFFLPYIIIESVTLNVASNSLQYSNAIFLFRKISSPIYYLIYTLAILWIPQKKQYIQLS